MECGGIRLASSPERMAEIRRQIGWATAYGLPLEEISAAEAQEMFPLIDPSGVVGGAYLASDGYLDPSQLCYALANLARGKGVQVHPHTRVTGIDAERGRVARVHTDRGTHRLRDGRQLRRHVRRRDRPDARRPAPARADVAPVRRDRRVPRAARGSPLPTLRDPDLLVYYRQEVDGLVMGGYERNAEPWTADARSYDAIPPDFNGRLLPEDWDRFEEITANSQVRVPAMADVGLRKIINGPEAFTPDNEFLPRRDRRRRLLRGRRLLRARHRRAPAASAR